MIQQGKQGRAGARKGFPCHSVKLGLLANDNNRYEVDSNTFFLKVKQFFLLYVEGFIQNGSEVVLSMEIKRGWQM